MFCVDQNGEVKSAISGSVVQEMPSQDDESVERKNAIRSDKTQLHVPIDTRSTRTATHTRERRIVSIVELTLILFRVRSSTLSRQHVQLLRIVMKS